MANKRITDVDFIEALDSDESFFVNQNNAIKQISKSDMIFDISNNGTIEPPYVDSVWILKTEQEPLRKLDAQSGDTIDVSSLEKQGHYILRGI